MGKKRNEERDREIARLYKEGMGVQELADKFGITDARVYQITIKHLGHKIKTKPDPEWLKDAIELRRKGKSLREISKALNAPYHSVNYHVGNSHELFGEKREETTQVSDRKFELIRGYRDPHSHQIVPCVMIKCSKPDCNNKLYFTKSNGAISPVHAANWFRNKGWIVGGSMRADLCPDHAHRLHTGKAEQPPEPVKKEETKPEQLTIELTEPPVKAAVAEPSKTDKRIIISKLNDVYGDGIYTKDWTDKKVATELGVAEEWVAKLRDEAGYFGPNVNASAAAEELKSLQGTYARLSGMASQLKEMHNGFVKRLDEFDEGVATYTEKIEQFYKDVQAFEEKASRLLNKDKAA